MGGRATPPPLLICRPGSCTMAPGLFPARAAIARLPSAGATVSRSPDKLIDSISDGAAILSASDASSGRRVLGAAETRQHTCRLITNSGKGDTGRDTTGPTREKSEEAQVSWASCGGSFSPSRGTCQNGRLGRSLPRRVFGLRPMCGLLHVSFFSYTLSYLAALWNATSLLVKDATRSSAA